jgi:ureidoacrylate peracid hydrolase
MLYLIICDLRIPKKEIQSLPSDLLGGWRWQHLLQMHEEPFLDFQIKVNPIHSAVIVIDVQNDFCHEKGALAEMGEDVNRIQQNMHNLSLLINEARSMNVLTIFIQSTYNTRDMRYLSPAWKEKQGRVRNGASICADGSWGQEFYGNIKPMENEIVVRKHRYSAFVGTDLDVILRSREIRTLILTGVTTNVCVETTARHGFMKDYYVVVLKDCVATQDAEEIEEASLYNIGKYFGEITSSEKLIEAWNKMKMPNQVVKESKRLSI